MFAACLLVGLAVGQVGGLPPCCDGTNPAPGCVDGTLGVTCGLGPPYQPPIPPDPKYTPRNVDSLPHGTFFSAGHDIEGSVAELSFDGTVRRVGPPKNGGLHAYFSAFDSNRKRIYGIGWMRDVEGARDGDAVTGITIDPRTGDSRLLQTLDRYPPYWLGDMTYGPDLDAMFYITRTDDGQRIVQWNPQTGQQVLVVQNGRDWWGLTYVNDFMGKYTGLLTIDESGWMWLFEGPRFERRRLDIRLPTNVNPARMFFDPTTGILFSTDHEFGPINRFDERSRTFVTVLWPRFDTEKTPYGFCFIPTGALEP